MLSSATKVLEAEFPQGIPQCGMDALRFALADYTHQGRAINLSVARVVAVRHFCNKVWNASRFVMSQLEPGQAPPALPAVSSLRLVDQWLLSRLRRAVCDIQSSFESLQLHRATSAFHSFFLYDFCDVYIEWSKLSLKSAEKVAYKTLLTLIIVPQSRSTAAVSILFECLETSLRLLHPFMPFLTEEIWQRLPLNSAHRSPSISLATFPTKDRFADLQTQQLEAQMQVLPW